MHVEINPTWDPPAPTIIDPRPWYFPPVWPREDSMYVTAELETDPEWCGYCGETACGCSNLRFG